MLYGKTSEVRAEIYKEKGSRTADGNAGEWK